MNQGLWDQLFPYHIRLNPELEIISVGRSVEKLAAGLIGCTFSEKLLIKRPRLAAISYVDLLALQDKLLLLHLRDLDVLLRGQVVVDESDSLIFCVSPWLTDITQMEGFGLSLQDFALHDPIMDLLQLLSYHAMSIEELHMQAIDLKKAREDAEVALKARSDFLSVMTHEIRTPLNAVIGMANQLLEENPRPDQLENLRTLRFSGENLLMLINDILDYSKLESAKIQLESKPVNLKELLGNIRKTFEPLARQQKISLLLHVDPKIPEAILGDATRISQVLFNLVGNALKFTPVGSVTLRVLRVSMQGKNARLRFEITDTGVGIPADKLSAIFEDFVQVRSSVSRTSAGTGLGLSICRKILQLHHSDIEVQSRLGEGSTFAFEMTAETTQAVVPAAVVFTSLRGMRVLLVEDNEINIKITTRYLKKWEVSFDVARNGVEALSYTAKNPYDLILMDLQMPEKDGYEATQEIRAASGNVNQQVPIIALSASLFDDVRKKALEVGLSSFLDKPFREQELHRILADHFLPRADTLACK